MSTEPSSTTHVHQLNEYHRVEIRKGLEEARSGKLIDYGSLKRKWMRLLSPPEEGSLRTRLVTRR